MNSNIEVRFEGFALEVQGGIHDEARRAATRAVEAALGVGWEIEEFAPGAGFFEVTKPGAPMTVGAAFEAAHALVRQPGVIDAEPLLAVPMPGPAEEDESVVAKAAADAATENRFESHLEQIAGKEAWDLPPAPGGQPRGGGVRIGQLDTGYTKHAELILGSRLRADLGRNLKEGEPDPIEPLSTIDHGHGTATGSVLISPEGRQLDGGLTPFVTGIAPDAELVPFRVDDNVWYLWSGKNDAKGIYHALKAECRVISMSRGGTNSSKLESAVRKARRQGVIVVAAAGNCIPTCGFKLYPASFDEVISVAATTVERTPWSKSSFGDAVDVSAPGHMVWRARTRERNNDYSYSIARSSGTSYATPLVAGTAALWIAHHGGWDRLAGRLGGAGAIPVVFRELLRTKGVDPGDVAWETDKYGAGILNAKLLLEAPLPGAPAVASLVQGDRRRRLLGSEKLAALGSVLGDGGLAQTAASRAAGVDGRPVDDLIAYELAFQAAVGPQLRESLSALADAGLDAPEFTVRRADVVDLLRNADVSDALRHSVAGT